MYTLLNRVCAPGEDEEQFTECQPDVHRFPLAVVCEHYMLIVTVKCLPRLQYIPLALVGGKNNYTKCEQQQLGPSKSVKTQETTMSKQVTVTRKVFSSLTQTSVDDLSKRTAEVYIKLPPSSRSDNSNDMTAATTLSSPSAEKTSPNFPFSPPQPSPMSPKLLSGLADVLPYSRLQKVTRQEEPMRQLNNNDEIDCPHSQLFCFDTGCVSHQNEGFHHSNKEIPASKPNQKRESIFPRRSESCSYPLTPSGVCPPSASSPVPFARKAANEKRRSLAINIKVSDVDVSV